MRYSETAMRARAARYNVVLNDRLVGLWKPTMFERFDGARVLCETFAQWESEVARYSKDSGGFTPKAAR